MIVRLSRLIKKSFTKSEERRVIICINIAKPCFRTCWYDVSCCNNRFVWCDSFLFFTTGISPSPWVISAWSLADLKSSKCTSHSTQHHPNNSGCIWASWCSSANSETKVLKHAPQRSIGYWRVLVAGICAESSVSTCWDTSGTDDGWGVFSSGR